MNELHNNVGVSRLVILGKFELFGLEDVLNSRKHRTMTIKCVSMEAECQYITKESFIHCVNQFKFSQSVIEEQIIRH